MKNPFLEFGLTQMQPNPLEGQLADDNKNEGCVVVGRVLIIRFVWRKELSFVERAGSVPRLRQVFEVAPALSDSSPGSNSSPTGSRLFNLTGEGRQRRSSLSAGYQVQCAVNVHLLYALFSDFQGI
jgi:hypothetical protein